MTTCKLTYTFANGFRLVSPYLHTINYWVKISWVGREIEEVLKAHWSFLPVSEVESIFANQRLTVDGKPVNRDYMLRLGETVGFTFHRHEPEVLDRKIDILHVDEDVVIVNKPPSIPVHPVGRFQMNSVLKILSKEHPELLMNGKKLNLVHRIDRVASGLLLLCRTNDVTTRFMKQFRQQTVAKEYLARVKGVFPEGKVEVKKPIISSNREYPHFVVSDVESEGKTAHGVFERESVSMDGEQSIVRCRPITGRTHQIRIHLQWLGYPIINDHKYGGELSTNCSLAPESVGYDKVPWCYECAHGTIDRRTVRMEDILNRYICLHSLRYSSTHPQHKWTFTAPRPTWADIETNI